MANPSFASSILPLPFGQQLDAQGFDSLTAAAAATIPSATTWVRTAGFAAAGDGGEALYKSTMVGGAGPGKFQSADGAWWIYVPSLSGANVKAFGAKGDGVTADTTAVQNALTFAANSNGVVYIPASATFYVLGQLTVPANVWLIGDSQQASQLLQTNLTGNFLTLGASSGLSALSIVSQSAVTAGAAIYINGNGVKLFDFTIYATGTGSQKFYAGIQFDPVNGGEYWIDDFTAVGCFYPILSGSPGNTTSVTPPLGIVSNGQLSAITGGTCIELLQNGGTTWSGIQCLFGAHGVATFPAAGQYVDAQLFINCECDTTSGDTWSIGANGGLVSDFALTNCWGCSSTGGSGLTIQGGGSGQVDGVVVTGGFYSNNFKSGIDFAVCTNITIQGASVFNNSQQGSTDWSGISVGANTNGFIISGCTSGLGGRDSLISSANLQGYGIVVNTGSSDYYNIVNNRCPSNVTGSVLDGGTGSHKTLTGNLAG